MSDEDSTPQFPDFVVIPGVLILDERLTPLDVKVYGVVYWMTRLRLKKCVVSNKVLAKYTQSHITSIEKSLARLDETGYIERTYKAGETGESVRDEIIPLIVFTSEKKSTPHPSGDLKPRPPTDRRYKYNKNNNDSSKDKGSASKDDTPFSLQEELEKMKQDKNRHIMLIGEYIEDKGLTPRNKYQLQQIIKRHLKPARNLADFDDDQIYRAYKQAEKEYSAWTLETLVKILTRENV